MDFHPTQVTGDGSGADAEEEVWEAMKNALGTEHAGVAYYRYPVVDKAGGQFDREPDIVLLQEDCGLLVIEVKGYQIQHIERIEGQTWHLTGISQDYATPYSQARDQGFFIRSWFQREPDLRKDGRVVIPANFTVALPNITRDEWEDAGFADIPASPRVITADDLSPQSLREHLLEEPGDTEDVTPEAIETAAAVLSGVQVISGERTPPPPDPTTKGELYETLLSGLKRFDQSQETIGAEIPPGPQRIRGIAGSGKTILMAKRAAHLHAKDPDADVALTYFTKSLNEEITDLTRHFHYQMTGADPDMDSLQVIHGWGGETVGEGIYFNVAQASGVEPLTVRDTQQIRGGPIETLEECCRRLVQNNDIEAIYDAILIDEGQDFGKWFYRMCYDALREPEEGQRRLYWAYDEAQTLGDLDVPTAREVFGEDDDGDPVVDLSGSYSNGIQKSRIMRRSYRSPREIIMLAHAFGMGIQRDDGPLDAAITNQDTWQAIGYEVDGDFVSDNDTRLWRPDEYSPHPLQNETEAKPAIRFEGFEDQDSEIEFVVDQIRRDLEERALDPRDIMVVPLRDPGSATEQLGSDIADALRERNIKPNLVWETEGGVFKQSGKVTISQVTRAKGNEAAQVYVVGAEWVEDDTSFIQLFARRNRAFVSLTRARGWCTVTSREGTPVAEELDDLVDEIAGEQEFTFPGEYITGSSDDSPEDHSLDDFNLLSSDDWDG